MTTGVPVNGTTWHPWSEAFVYATGRTGDGGRPQGVQKEDSEDRWRKLTVSFRPVLFTLPRQRRTGHRRQTRLMGTGS